MKKTYKPFNEIYYVFLVLTILFLCSCKKEYIEPKTKDLVFPKHQLPLVDSIVNIS